MRLKDEMIEYLARTIVDNLAKKGGYIEFKEKKDKVENEIKMVIREDLQVEDRLNEEVKEARVPSDKLKVVRPFDVEAEQTTVLTLPWISTPPSRSWSQVQGTCSSNQP